MKVCFSRWICLLLAFCFLLSACTATEPETSGATDISEPTEVTVPVTTSVAETEPASETTEPVPVVHSIILEDIAGDDGLWCETVQDGKTSACFYKCAFPIQYNFENLTPAESCDVSGISDWIRFYREDGTAEVILYAGDILCCTVDGRTEWFVNAELPGYEWLLSHLSGTIRRVNGPVRTGYSISQSGTVTTYDSMLLEKHADGLWYEISQWDYQEWQNGGIGTVKVPGPITSAQAEEFLNTIEAEVSALGTSDADLAKLANLFLRCTSAVAITDTQDFDWSLFVTEDASGYIGFQSILMIKGGFFPWRMDRNFEVDAVHIDGDQAVVFNNDTYLYFRLIDGRWLLDDISRPSSR